ncbi:MAG: DUF58 domain-containing protein [Leptolyngbya sp.]|nr:MAG: DUF58 domain-containing protein [Leptolyngbya sp.]
MRSPKRVLEWLETHWVTPAYGGGLLAGLSIFFFVAATNTLSGWLYVMSGVGLALLAIAAILPERTLRQVSVHRAPIHPVSAGDQITVELIVENQSSHAKMLLQVEDVLPEALGKPVIQAIEEISPTRAHHWIYSQLVEKRGIYRWQTLHLRTAAPLGLFWCRRPRTANAIAIVYPTVLPLTHCPLIDEMGRDQSLLRNSDRRAQTASEGLTRSLRPYRWGDPIRMVHWRTSARYGELRVRELETFTGGQELVICLDSAFAWLSSDSVQNDFEDAVIAAASLYFYACRQNLQVQLWTASTGLIQGNQAVLETLAETRSGESLQASSLPTTPVLWLTQNPYSLSALPSGSRWILWQAIAPLNPASQNLTVQRNPGILVQPDQTLQMQLQLPATR